MATCGVADGRDDIFMLKIGHFLKYLFKGQPCGKQIQDVRYTNPHSSDARTPAALTRMEGNPVTWFRHGHPSVTSATSDERGQS